MKTTTAPVMPQLPYTPPASVDAVPQATTAVLPPPTLRTAPQVNFPYGAGAGDSRPY